MNRLFVLKKALVLFFKAVRWEYKTWKNKRKPKTSDTKSGKYITTKEFEEDVKRIHERILEESETNKIIVPDCSKIKVNQLEGGLNFIEYAGDKPEIIPPKKKSPFTVF